VVVSPGEEIEINGDGGETIMGQVYEVLEPHLDLPAVHWPEKLIAHKERTIGGGVALIGKPTTRLAAFRHDSAVLRLTPAKERERGTER
jgi:hypothetical protein